MAHPHRQAPARHLSPILVLLLAVAAFGALLLAACTAPQMPTFSAQPTTPPPTVPLPASDPVSTTLSATLTFTPAGFSLSYPHGWQSRALSRTLLLAPDAATLDADSPGDGLFILIDATPLEEVATLGNRQPITDTQAIFERSTAGPQQAGYSLGATQPITLDGRSGLAADMQAAGGAGRLVVVVVPPHVVRMMGQASPAAWEAQAPRFDAIAATLRFPERAAVAQPTPTPASRVQQPVRLLEGPAGFVLRLGGNSGPLDGRFISARGVAVGEDGRVFLAESSQGVWVFEPDGTLVATFGTEALLDAYDVAVGPDGDLFVADYGRNAIARFTPDGTLVNRWGEAGNEPEQFGLLSPQRIAVGSDGSVYALDTHTAADGSSATSSVVRFDGNDGAFIERIALPPASSPGDLAVDALGNIYLAETFRGMVLKLNSAGQVVAQLGEHLMEGGIKASVLDLDSAGNLYVATWNAGVLQLSPDGMLMAQGGTMVESGTTPQAGRFILPNGIARSLDGVVWVSDNDGEYSAVTALRLVSDTEAQATAVAQATSTPQAPPTPTPALLRQWASSATASSQYSDEYSAANVVGVPDVAGCEDSTSAWASAEPDGLDTLEVSFDVPVQATGVNIHQNHQPGFITQVEVLDSQNKATSVYTGTARLHNVCPSTMEVSFDPMPFRISRVRLTIDQRSGANWSEIDAVELVGIP
jgi:streptogramin lyase